MSNFCYQETSGNRTAKLRMLAPYKTTRKPSRERSGSILPTEMISNAFMLMNRNLFLTYLIAEKVINITESNEDLPSCNPIDLKVFRHVTTPTLLKLLEVSTAAIILPSMTLNHSSLSCHRLLLTVQLFHEGVYHGSFVTPQLLPQHHRTNHFDYHFNADFRINAVHHLYDNVSINKITLIALVLIIRTT